MSDVSNLRDTIVPKSDQLNAEQLLSGPITVTVTAVNRGTTDEQPVILNYDGDNGRPYKPCKSMRKVLIFAWGDDGRQWVGRSMTLFNNPDVKFGGVKVGGIRISHLSHIERDIALSLTATKGKKEEFIIRKLETTAPKIEEALDAIADAVDLDTLQQVFGEAWAAHKAKDARAKLKAVYDTRKEQLAVPTGATVDGTTGEII